MGGPAIKTRLDVGWHAVELALIRRNVCKVISLVDETW